MRANVSEDDVRSFSEAVRNQQERAREMSEKIRSMAQEAQNQIRDEYEKASELIAQCDEELSSLNSQIEDLNSQIEQLNSQLSTIPPKIKKVYVDEDGNETVVEEDNPAYLAVVAQINLLNSQLKQLQNKVKEVQSKKEELQMQAASLRATMKDVAEISESVGGCEYTTEELSSEALKKLKILSDVIAEYNGIKIEGLSSRLFGVEVDGNMRNVIEAMPEQKSAIQKMADYLKKHDYGMGDSDKYMQDPEWKALSEDLADEIEEQEKELLKRYGVITVDNKVKDEQKTDKNKAPSGEINSNLQNWDYEIDDDLSFGFAKIDRSNKGAEVRSLKRKLYGWLGILCACFGYSIAMGMPEVKAYNPLPWANNTEIRVFRNDDNDENDENKMLTNLVVKLDSIENIIKFYGESCSELAEAMSDNIKKEKELIDSINLEKNKNECTLKLNPRRDSMMLNKTIKNANTRIDANYRGNKKIWR